VRRKLQTTGGFFLVGYALHYWPFFIMGRALFIHHYLPALVFSFFATATVFDFMTILISKFRGLLAFVLCLLFVYAFYVFAPFAYGLSLTPEQVSARKWIGTWDFQYGLKD
jgi:dolichyl-phosphate-mannose-protein mannosyltransferase